MGRDGCLCFPIFVCNGGVGADYQVALPLDVFFRIRAVCLFGGRYADVDGSVAARLEFRFSAVCGADTVPQAENPLLQTAVVDFRLFADCRLAELGNAVPL